MKKAIEYLLFNASVSNYQISKATGIRETTLSKYATGESDVGNMTLNNATKLYNHFKEVIEMMQKENGYTYHGETELTLTQQAYIDSDFSLGYDRAVYKAHAIDNQGNEYSVVWLPHENYQEIDDASDHCDWDSPYEVEQL